MSDYHATTVDSCIIEDFWSCVDRSGGPDSCWPWLRTRDKNGYGIYHVNGRPIRAPRFVLVYAERTMADLKLWALHRCDNPPCCNPAHLFAGTAQDNMDDMWAKGRGADGDRHWSHKYPDKVRRGDQTTYRMYPEKAPRGDDHYARREPHRLARGDRSGARTHPERWCRAEAHYKASLTNDQVREIRRRHAAGERQKDLAIAFNVAKGTISRIIRRKTYASVD